MPRTRALFILACLLGLSVLPALPESNPGIEASVVRILNHAQRGDWYSPWNASGSLRSSGSAFIIEGGRIMTNAHVVSDTRMLLFFLEGDPEPHEGKVVAIGHDCDLALVEAVEPGLLDGLPVARFGTLPALRSVVETRGYPAGGERISSTRGVVSRIEMHVFAHSAVDAHLTVQTDAAINPGNSGGPVFQDGRVVGVAFQGVAGLDNVGFFIPTEIIQHFLADVADGIYDGYPELGAATVNLENPAARRKAGMGPGQSGVIVDRVAPASSAEGFLQVGDILLSVDGSALANDGTTMIDGLRLDHAVLLDRHQVGETVQLELLRHGEVIAVDVPMKPLERVRRLANIYDRLPRYYIVGGLVFVELDREMLKTYGKDWFARADKTLIYESFFREIEAPETSRQHVVVLLRRLDHPVNAEMSWFKNLVVDRVNSHRIDGLESLVNAVESNKKKYHLFEFGYHGRFGVLDREAAEEAHQEILDLYAIPQDRRL